MKIEQRKYSLFQKDNVCVILSNGENLCCPHAGFKIIKKKWKKLNCGNWCPAFQIIPEHSKYDAVNLNGDPVKVDYKTTVKLACFPQPTEFIIEDSEE